MIMHLPSASHPPRFASDSPPPGSRVYDLSIAWDASSIRNVVSVNSTQFMHAGNNGGFGSPSKIQGAHVYNYGFAANGSMPAVSMGGRGPLQVFDSLFLPANASSPALSWCCDAGNGAVAAAFLSNVTSAGPLIDPAANISHVYYVPDGDPAVAATLPHLTPETVFLTSAWRAEGRVFDAVAMGADPTCKNSSVKALQACMDAAAAAGDNAVCYLPTPATCYSVDATLRACGSDWTLLGGGSGFQTTISWSPALNASRPGITMATGPAAGCATTNLTLAQLALSAYALSPYVLDLAISRDTSLPASVTCPWNPLGNTFNATCRPQMIGLLPGGGSAAAPVTVRLDSVYGISGAGVVLKGLQAGDTVSGRLLDATVEIIDSDNAVFLPQFLCPEWGGVVVSRSRPAAPNGRGLLGATAMFTASSVYDLWAFNSTSFSVADWYTETGAVS